MKIVMFGHKSVPSRDGGVEVVVTRLSRELADRGHRVTCYNRRCTEKSEDTFGPVRLKTVPTIRCKGLAAVSASFFAALCSAFSHADVVHIHGEGPAAMCLIPKLMGKRVVVTVHGLDWQREKWKGTLGAGYIRMGERMAVRCADAIIVLSHQMQRYFRETYGRETVLIPNGIDISDPVEAEAVPGLEPDSYLLFLGRLVPEKGVHRLIEAYRGLKTDKKLVIAGAASDTKDYVNHLKKLAAGDDRILFPGFVQGGKLEWLYRNAYVYVLPSSVEGMPLSQLEALSRGCCCAVSDIPECTEVVRDMGAVFEKGDVTSLARCLQRLCDDPEAVKRYRAAARQMDKGQYDWDRIARRTLELYR